MRLSVTLSLLGNSARHVLAEDRLAIVQHPLEYRLADRQVADRPAPGPDRLRGEHAALAILEQHESALGAREDLEERSQHLVEELAEDQGRSEGLADLLERPELLFRLDHRIEPIAGRRHVDRREDRGLVLVAILDLHRLALVEELKLADLERAAVLERHRLGELLAVEVSTARAAEILEHVFGPCGGRSGRAAATPTSGPARGRSPDCGR